MKVKTNMLTDYLHGQAGWQEIINALEDNKIRKAVIGHEKMEELKDKGNKLMEDIIVRKQLK